MDTTGGASTRCDTGCAARWFEKQRFFGREGNTTMRTTAVAVALALGVSAPALADEPFVLGAEDMDKVTAAGLFDYTAVGVSVLVFETAKLIDVASNINSSVNAVGQSATANAFADAVGSPNAITETDTFEQVEAANLLTQSGSSSLAALIGTEE